MLYLELLVLRLGRNTEWVNQREEASVGGEEIQDRGFRWMTQTVGLRQPEFNPWRRALWQLTGAAEPPLREPGPAGAEARSAPVEPPTTSPLEGRRGISHLPRDFEIMPILSPRHGTQRR
jgi:hypothetical protein